MLTQSGCAAIMHILQGSHVHVVTLGFTVLHGCFHAHLAQARYKQLAAAYRQLLQQLNISATTSWRGSARDAVKAAMAQHAKQLQGGVCGWICGLVGSVLCR